MNINRRLGHFGVIVLSLMMSAAQAIAGDSYLFQWNDLQENVLYGDTYQNGVLIQHAAVGPESYDGTYGLWAGQVSQTFDARFNIYEPNGQLSDTWRIAGNAGDTFLTFQFYSDVEGQSLLPLSNAVSIFETGSYQTVLQTTTTNGDLYTWQFASDVPEPSTWALLIIGFAGLGYLSYRRHPRLLVQAS